VHRATFSEKGSIFHDCHFAQHGPKTLRLTHPNRLNRCHGTIERKAPLINQFAPDCFRHLTLPSLHLRDGLHFPRRIYVKTRSFQTIAFLTPGISCHAPQLRATFSVAAVFANAVGHEKPFPPIRADMLLMPTSGSPCCKLPPAQRVLRHNSAAQNLHKLQLPRLRDEPMLGWVFLRSPGPIAPFSSMPFLSHAPSRDWLYLRRHFSFRLLRASFYFGPHKFSKENTLPRWPPKRLMLFLRSSLCNSPFK